MRPAIEVRAVHPRDIDGLVALCLAARQESAVGSQVCTADPQALGRQVATLAAAPGSRLLVAHVEGTVVGLLLARLVGPNPFTDETSLAVEGLYVASDHRRRGAGHALMTAAAATAAEAGAAHIHAAPLPGARGMQRFFVQLGFAPAAAHRMTTTAALQRRLAHEASPAVRRAGTRGLEDLIARRRQTRDSGRSLPVPVDEGDQSGRRAAISRHVRRAVQTRWDVESSTTIS